MVMLPLPGIKYTRATESLRLPVVQIAPDKFGFATTFVALDAAALVAGADFLTVVAFFVAVVFFVVVAIIRPFCFYGSIQQNQ